MPKSIRPLLIIGATVLVLLFMCSGPLLPPAAQIPVTLPATPLIFVELPTVTPAPASGARDIASAPTAAPANGAAAPAAPFSVATPTTLDARGLAIDTYMTGLVTAQSFHGTILVARDGQVVISKGYGTADPASGTPHTAQTRFRLASLTKGFTAAAIMQLQVRGLLTVGDPICEYLDDCPDTWRSITIHQLLNHTSGIPNYTDFIDFDPTEMQPTTPAALVARFRNLPLNFAPGELYYYGNSGYVLLGLIIERVSGQSYADFVRDNIFIPLGMENSGYDTSVGAVNGVAVGYNTFAQPSSFIDVSTLYAAGALYSTVEDMYRWDQALTTDRLLPQIARDQMFTPYLRDYGYGWKISRPGGRLLIDHPGNMTGSSTYIARYPNDRVTVIVLSNMYWADSIGIGNQLAQIALGP